MLVRTHVCVCVCVCVCARACIVCVFVPMMAGNPVAFSDFQKCTTCPCPPYIAKYGPLSEVIVASDDVVS